MNTLKFYKKLVFAFICILLSLGTITSVTNLMPQRAFADPLSSSKSITSYSIHGISGTIYESTGDVYLNLPCGDYLPNNLIATFTHTGIRAEMLGIEQISGVTSRLYDGYAVGLDIVAEDGTKRNWAIHVIMKTCLSSENSFLTFSILGNVGIIDEVNKMITVTVPAGTNLSSLAASFTTSPNSDVTWGTKIIKSEVTKISYAVPVTLTVSAQDSTEQDYIVTVIVSP